MTTATDRILTYLKRIGLKNRPAPTVKNLFILQRQHLLHVPYEDIDIWRGQAGALSFDELFDKIVLRRRGGYCFELNGLFGWLLRELGYETEEHFGRWLMGESLEIPARRHRIVRVKINGTAYVADVGVGQRAPLTPLELVQDRIQTREGVDYRIVRHGRLGNVVEVCVGGAWSRMYSFDDAVQEPIDFNYVHYYCANHPASFFRNNLLVHLPTLTGRKSIGSFPDPETGESVPVLSIGGAKGTTRTFLRTPASFASALRRHFGIIA